MTARDWIVCNPQMLFQFVHGQVQIVVVHVSTVDIDLAYQVPDHTPVIP